MKNKLKYIVLLLIIIMSFTSTPIAFAESASLSVSGGGSYTKGSSLSITYTYSASSVGSATATISYDNSVLEYVSASSNAEVGGSSGVLYVTTVTGSNTPSLSTTLNFRAVGAGSTTVNVSTQDIYNHNFEMLSCGSSSTSVTVTNPAPTVSSNANLSSLYVSAGSLSPSFSAGRTSYTVHVDEDETVCLISAEAQDSGATIDVTGSKNLIMGRNVRKVVVTAPSGNTKTYTITIYRGEASSDGEEEKPEDEKVEEITTVIGETTYVIQENIKSEDVPEEFLLVVGKYEGKDIPLVKSVDLKYTLALLKNQETGDLKWFFFNEEAGAFAETIAMTADEAMLFAKLSANDTKEEDDSLFGDNEIVLFLILGSTVLLLAVVIIVLQFKIVKGKKKKKNKKVEEIREEVLEENTEEIQEEIEEILDEE